MRRSKGRGTAFSRFFVFVSIKISQSFGKTCFLVTRTDLPLEGNGGTWVYKSWPGPHLYRSGPGPLDDIGAASVAPAPPSSVQPVVPSGWALQQALCAQCSLYEKGRRGFNCCFLIVVTPKIHHRGSAGKM